MRDGGPHVGKNPAKEREMRLFSLPQASWCFEFRWAETSHLFLQDKMTLDVTTKISAKHTMSMYVSHRSVFGIFPEGEDKS